MGNINRVPLGLLSLLDSQTQGQAPSLMGDGVQAGAEMLPFWLNSKGIESIQAAAAIQAASGQSNLSINVPEGELWLVTHASARSYSGAAASELQQIQLTYFPTQQTGVNSISLAQSISAGMTTGGVLSCAVNYSTAEPFFARAGSRFGCYLSFTVPPATGSIPEIAVLFYRLKI